MPTLVEIKNIILEFEKDQAVHAWSYEGMNLWPVLRSLVYVECRNEILSSENGVQLDWKKAREKRKLRSILSKLTSYFKNQKSRETTIPENQSIEGEKEVLFFGSWYFRSFFEGAFINKFYYPLISYLKEELKISALEVEYSTHPKYFLDYQKLKGELDFVENYTKVDHDSQREKALLNSHLFDAFFNSLEAIGVNEKLRFQTAQKIEKIYADSFIYEAIFKRYRPKIAFCLTFFNEAMFAMIFAASKTGVKTIDLGHGFPSDKENMIYNKLTNVPEDGYNTLPDLFWVWDDPVKVALDQWCSLQNKHQVIVGGNPWLEYCQPRLLSQALSSKTIVLYTLTVSLPEDFILEAMKKTESKYEWWVRLHPSIRGTQNELEEIFKTNFIKNFNLVEANTLDLPLLLKNVDVHVSRNSSSIYESVFFGNTPIILDKEGMDYFDFYLESGQALGLSEKSPKELIHLIQVAEDLNRETEVLHSTYQTSLNFLFKGQKVQKPYSIVL